MADTRLPDPARLTEVFLWQERLRGDKTARVSLGGDSYEIDPRLAPGRIELR